MLQLALIRPGTRQIRCLMCVIGPFKLIVDHYQLMAPGSSAEKPKAQVLSQFIKKGDLIIPLFVLIRRQCHLKRF